MEPQSNDTWTPTAGAVLECRALFGLDDTEARRRLVQLAADEQVKTRCLTLIVRDGRGGKSTYENCDVPIAFWEQFPRGATKADWANGFFEIEGEYDSIWGTETTTLHGVVFSTTDLIKHSDRLIALAARGANRAMPNPAPPPPIQISQKPGPISPLRGGRSSGHDASTEVTTDPGTPVDQPREARRPRANPVSPAEIDKWFKSLTKAQETLGVTALWELAKDCHPGRHLPRKLVEPFGKDRGTGHRSKV